MSMKALLYFILLIPFLGFAQVTVSGKILDNDGSPFPGVTIELKKEGKAVQKVQSELEGNFTFTNIPEGNYSLRLEYVVMRVKVIENFEVNANSSGLVITYPGPCPESKKVCPHGHSDKIIPIVYGLPSYKTMRKADKGKVKLGGCDPSFCERWHCKIHDIDF